MQFVPSIHYNYHREKRKLHGKIRIYCFICMEPLISFSLFFLILSTRTRIHTLTLHSVVTRVNLSIEKNLRNYLNRLFTRIESNRIGNWISIYFWKSFDLFFFLFFNNMIYTFFSWKAPVLTYMRTHIKVHFSLVSMLL